MWPLKAGQVAAGLLLPAFALRAYELAAQSLWYDEAVSWYLTRMPLAQLTEWTANDIQPPLYYYLLWLWVHLAGASEFALRYPSVVCSLLTLPLMWRLARRLFGSRAGFLALLLGAVSPLHVYYAQEARMYSLVTLLGLLSSCLLVRMLDGVGEPTGSGARRRYPAGAIAYVLSAAAALYTHYFAVFLLAAHAVYAGHRLRQRARHRPAPQGGDPGSDRVARGRDWKLIAVPLAILALYLPWLPYLLGRYGLDSSYWPGALKMEEVARKLFISFGLGETVREQIGIWLAIGYGAILVFGVAAVIRQDWIVRRSILRKDEAVYQDRRSHPFDSMVLLLAYLLVPVVLVLALAYRTPKFNPRYAMLAWPAFTLLIAGGLSGGWRSALTDRGRLWRRLAVGLGLTYVLVTSGYALANWYAPYRDNQFNKADFRITAGIVRERLGTDETVLLSSGHMFPAWAYYYGWQNWHALPDIQVLDVNAALDLSVGQRLTDLLAGRRGVWLVRWQNETTDPFDVLPLLLGGVGKQDDYGQFWHMELRHYELPSTARFDVASFVDRPAAATFGGQVRLIGVRAKEPTTSPGEKTGELVLIWQVMTPPDADYTVFAHLLDDAGHVLATGDHRPARPMRGWPPGAILPDRASITPINGVPDGDYQLEIGLYDADRADLPRLGPVVDHATGQLWHGERVLIPVTVRAGRFE